MKQSNFPYKTGDAGYNRQSGRKTLLFVGICISLAAIFSLLTIFTILQQ